jgi:SAM-dependent methyltransferase
MLNSPMDEESRRRVRDVQFRVTAMLTERQSLQDPAAPPSSYWADFCSAFDYILGLPEPAFLKLRIHTYHFTAETYQTYYFGDPAAFWAANHITELTEGIPAELVINEPPAGIGFRFPPDRFISEDTVRFQKVINTLYRHRILETLKAKASPRVLEIGAGYGGLAHHLGEVIRGAAYVIVDLPEALLFSAAYLTLQNPGKRIYLYSPNDDQQAIASDVKAGRFDFVLIPNYKLDLLRSLEFDLVVNTASLQEMKADQVERYLNFIRDTCNGVFYSRNQDRQPRNQELVSLTSMIQTRFKITEVPEWRPRRTERQSFRKRMRSAARLGARVLGLLEQPPQGRDDPYREFICTPLRSDTSQ